MTSRTLLLLSMLTLAAVAETEDQRRARAAEAKAVSEILVTGMRLDAGVPVVPMDSIGSRDVLGPAEVRETGARDLNDLLLNLPAISTRPYNGGEAAAPSFSMRGLPDDGLTEYIHVLIDGVPASPLPYGWTAFSFLPVTPDRIYAIDYIRGGHAVRYSPNTVGGILNLVTRPIPAEPTVEMRTTVGDHDFLSTLISAGGSRDRWGAIGTVVDRRGDGYRRMGFFDQQDTNAKVRWDLAEDSWIAASVSYMQSGHQAPGGLSQADFDADPIANTRPLNRFDGNRSVVDMVYHRDLDEGDWFEGFAYFSETNRHLHAQRPNEGTPTEFRDWTDTSYFWAIGGRAEKKTEFWGLEHTLYGGARFQREWIPSWRIYSMPVDGGAPALLQDSFHELNAFSVHLDDTFHPVDRMTVVVGVRLEWVPTAGGHDDVVGWTFDDSFIRVLPGIGASYEITSRATCFANYFEGFRSPQVWAFGGTAAGTDLKFELGRSAEVGARYRGAGGANLSVTGWRTEFDDFGVYYTGFYDNLGRIVAFGVDIEAEWRLGEVWEALDGFSVVGSLTLQNSELKSGPDAGNDTPYAWHQKATWRLRYAKSGWSATIGGSFVGDSFSDEANTAAPSADGRIGRNPSRVLWDARLAKLVELGEKARLEIAVGATNLFDNDWYVHSRGGFFGGGLVSGPPLQGYASVNLVVTW